MQKITIASVESKTGTSDKGPWIKTTVTGADGLKASGFDPALAKLQPGAIIEAEIEVKGKFTNIGKFSVVSQGPAPLPGQGIGETKTPAAAPPERTFYGKNLEVIKLEEQGRNYREELQRLSIEGQVALKEVGEILRLDEERAIATLGQDIVALYKEILRERLTRMLIPTNLQLDTPKEPPLNGAEKDASRKLEPIPNFQTPSDLANWWMLNGLTWLDIQGALGIKTLAEIKDLKATHNTLAKIKAARDTQKPKTEG